MYTGGNTTQLSPDGFRTAIDKFVHEEYEREELPQNLTSRDEMFFKQATTDKMAVIFDEYSNVGLFKETGEQEELTTTNVRIGNQKTVTLRKWIKKIPISVEAMKTDQVGLRAKIGRNIGDRARLTQDRTALLDTYGDAFAGSVTTTPDGQPMASNSHLTLTGATVDNLELGAFTPDNAWTLNVRLGSQQAQDGEWGGYNLAAVAVPLVLYKTAKEVMNSTLLANGGENNLNIFDTDYGQVAIKQSGILGSTYNSASNANTSYHFLSRMHTITRNVLADLEMDPPVEPRFSDNDNWMLVNRYLEVSYMETFSGYAASNGSA